MTIRAEHPGRGQLLVRYERLPKFEGSDKYRAKEQSEASGTIVEARARVVRRLKQMELGAYMQLVNPDPETPDGDHNVLQQLITDTQYPRGERSMRAFLQNYFLNPLAYE